LQKEGRKVRAVKGTVLPNGKGFGWRRPGHGKCNRKQTADADLSAGKGERVV
jgi:hypothetical protein